LAARTYKKSILLLFGLSLAYYLGMESPLNRRVADDSYCVKRRGRRLPGLACHMRVLIRNMSLAGVA
jgi:hypothetical protein